MFKRRPAAIIDLYNLMLAAFLFVSPWLFAFAHGVAEMDVRASAAAIAAASIAALFMFAEWQEWVSLVVGLWLASSPFVLGFQHTTAMHIGIGIGITVSYLAALDLWYMHYGPQPD